MFALLRRRKVSAYQTERGQTSTAKPAVAGIMAGVSAAKLNADTPFKAKVVNAYANTSPELPELDARFTAIEVVLASEPFAYRSIDGINAVTLAVPNVTVDAHTGSDLPHTV